MIIPDYTGDMTDPKLSVIVKQFQEMIGILNGKLDADNFPDPAPFNRLSLFTQHFRIPNISNVDLRLVAGRVNDDGTIEVGEGFTVSKGAAGIYTVTFSVAFGRVPTILHGFDRTTATCTVFHDTVTASSFRAISRSYPLDVDTDSDWDFCAIGTA